MRIEVSAGGYVISHIYVEAQRWNITIRDSDSLIEIIKEGKEIVGIAYRSYRCLIYPEGFVKITIYSEGGVRWEINVFPKENIAFENMSCINLEPYTDYFDIMKSKPGYPYKGVRW